MSKEDLCSFIFNKLDDLERIAHIIYEVTPTESEGYRAVSYLNNCIGMVSTDLEGYLYAEQQKEELNEFCDELEVLTGGQK